jgi:hypothetical protein
VQAFIQSLIGAVVGGLFVLGATWLALRGQFKLQQQEWQRRDREREDDLARREKLQTEEHDRTQTAAIQALALEAFSNSMALLDFTRTSKLGSSVVAELTRSQYEASLPIIVRRLSETELEQVVTVYASAIRFDLTRKAKAKNPRGGAWVVEKQEIDEALNLSQLFMVVFRLLAKDVFSRQQRDVFERRRIVAHQSAATNT